MNLFTIGFTQKTAKQFFELIKSNQINLLIDVRLNNKSQLAGFTKGNDLEYFLAEICHCKYIHCLEYAPTKEILNEYKKEIISWEKYVELYSELIIKRRDYQNFYNKYSSYSNVCLLCSEPTATQCHRRLMAEIIANHNQQIIVKHI